MPELSYDEVIETLYNLDQEELRSLARECLLISDGPDSPFPTTNPLKVFGSLRKILGT